MTGLRKLVAGNWKMHGVSDDLSEIEAIATSSKRYSSVEVALCVPAILIERAARAATDFRIGGQDIHHAQKGAHTGCISAHMLMDAGATLTIVGHSERREHQRETDAQVRLKTEMALSCGLDVILCVGETLEVRERGDAVPIVLSQLEGSLPSDLHSDAELAIAYEPVWAIGSGKVPTSAEIAQMHGAIRTFLVDRYGSEGERIRILYGGSVKASNAGEIFKVPNVDGALVGGASLKAQDFIPIVAAAASA